MAKRWLWALGMVFWVAAASGQTAAPGLPAVKLEEYQAQVTRARALVSECRAESAACKATGVGADARVQDGGFEVHWGWLRESLESAKKARAEDREKLLSEVSARLEDEAREAGSGEAGRVESNKADFGRARAGADAVLARGEFRSVTETALMQRLLARVAGWLQRWFSGTAGLGRYAAWIVPLLEWGFLLAVAVGALLWAQRVMRRQQLAVAMEGPQEKKDWEEVSRRWEEAAAEAAARGDWREAVHAVYWASVVALEGRRVWRQVRERTPREYLRLLGEGSPYQRPVRLMTQLLERIWYGLGEAGRGDYDRALALYEEVRAA